MEHIKTKCEHHKDIWVYVSHSNEDFDKVRNLREILERYQYRPIFSFFSCKDDDPDVDPFIKREIESRTRFIICNSGKAMQSKWCQQEVEHIKELCRTYCEVDLSAPLYVIEKKIKDFSSNTHIYVSCPKVGWSLAEELVRRLRKYDYNVFFDVPQRRRCDESFQKQFNEEVAKSNKCGLFVCFVDSETFKDGSESNKELQIALDNCNRIVPIFLERFLPDSPLFDKLRSLEYVKAYDTENALENSLRHILTITHQPGSLITLAQNIDKNATLINDTTETDFCGHIVLDAAEKEPSDYSLLLLKGKCYENGFGAEIDLEKAYQCYSDAFHKGHVESAQEGVLRLEKELGLR